MATVKPIAEKTLQEVIDLRIQLEEQSKALDSILSPYSIIRDNLIKELSGGTGNIAKQVDGKPNPAYLEFTKRVEAYLKMPISQIITESITGVTKVLDMSKGKHALKSGRGTGTRQ